MLLFLMVLLSGLSGFTGTVRTWRCVRLQKAGSVCSETPALLSLERGDATCLQLCAPVALVFVPQAGCERDAGCLGRPSSPGG